MRELRCYICSQLVPQNKFHHHLTVHLLTGNGPAPQQARSGTQGPANPTPPQSSARPPRKPSPPQSEQPWPASTLYRDWEKDHPDVPSSMYTTIDGHQRGPSLQEDHSIQTVTAQVLRETTKWDVVKIVQEFNGLRDSEKETCIKLVRDVPILPGLVAYIYTHLITCRPSRVWIFKNDWTENVSDLRREVDSLRARGELHCVLNYEKVKQNLLQILDTTKVQPDQHACNSGLLNGTMLIKQDIQNLAALVVLCITGPDKDKIMHAQGSKAVLMVDLLHDLLDAPVDLEEGCRRYLFDTLILLAKTTGHCPAGLRLSPGIINGLVVEKRGGFGVVYKGEIGSRAVAVKNLIHDRTVNLEDDKVLCKEAIIWRHLRHPNCLPLYGVYTWNEDNSTTTSALVSPWMTHGTLFDYLKRNPTANRTPLILDMVRGLDYLHSMRPHVAHRDIKPENILVTKGGRACLADFGLSSVFDNDPHFHTAPSQLLMGGTAPYMAPEISKAATEEAKRKVNKRLSDMYALGCTIYATYTLKPPVPAAHQQRPQFPEGKISHDMWDFIESLWHQVPEKRLTAERSLAWMKFKAQKEGIPTSPPNFEEEWLWKGSGTASLLSIA